MLNLHESLDENIILGEPFFKNYDIGFNINSYKVGFSRIYVNNQV